MSRWTKDHLPKFGWAEYRKTALTRMAPIAGPAVVETQEGEYELPAGWVGFVAVDKAGFPYPIERAEQASTYEPVDADGAFETIPTDEQQLADAIKRTMAAGGAS